MSTEIRLHNQRGGVSGYDYCNNGYICVGHCCNGGYSCCWYGGNVAVVAVVWVAIFVIIAVIVKCISCCRRRGYVGGVVQRPGAGVTVVSTTNQMTAAYSGQQLAPSPYPGQQVACAGPPQQAAYLGPPQQAYPGPPQQAYPGAYKQPAYPNRPKY